MNVKLLVLVILTMVFAIIRMEVSTVLAIVDIMAMVLIVQVSKVYSLLRTYVLATHIDYLVAVLCALLDIDECSMDTDNCNESAICTDTPGSFDCTCNTGYTGDGVYCEGVYNTVHY